MQEIKIQDLKMTAMNEDPEMMLQIKQYRNFDGTELFSSQNDHKFNIFTALKMANYIMGYFTLKISNSEFSTLSVSAFLGCYF